MEEQPISKWWRWVALRRDIWNRVRDPLEHPSFFFYFFFFVFGLGSAGTWVELIKLKLAGDPNYSLNGVTTSLVTFASALIGTSCTQISIDERATKALKTLAQGILVLYVFGVVIAAVGIGEAADVAVIWAAASVFALIVWWIANARSPGLRDPEAPTGGSVNRDLPGDLAGYKTD